MFLQFSLCGELGSVCPEQISIPVSAQGQVGWGLEQPGVVEVSLPWAGGWTWILFEIPSNPNRSRRLCWFLPCSPSACSRVWTQCCHRAWGPAVPKCSPGRQILAVLQPWPAGTVPLVPTCGSEGAAPPELLLVPIPRCRTGSQGSKYPFPWETKPCSPCRAAAAWQGDTQSSAVGACRLHAGLSCQGMPLVPVPAAGAPRAHPSSCASCPGRTNPATPRLCSTAGRCKARVQEGIHAQGTALLPWGRHREEMNVLTAKECLSSWGGSQPQSLLRKTLNQLNPLCRVVGRCLLHLPGVRNATQNSLDVEFLIHSSCQDGAGDVGLARCFWKGTRVSRLLQP